VPICSEVQTSSILEEVKKKIPVNGAMPCLKKPPTETGSDRPVCASTMSGRAKTGNECNEKQDFLKETLWRMQLQDHRYQQESTQASFWATILHNAQGEQRCIVGVLL